MWCGMLCCSELSCAVLCCAGLCCAVVCFDVLCCAVLRCGLLERLLTSLRQCIRITPCAIRTIHFLASVQ